MHSEQSVTQKGPVLSGKTPQELRKGLLQKHYTNLLQPRTSEGEWQKGDGRSLYRNRTQVADILEKLQLTRQRKTNL